MTFAAEQYRELGAHGEPVSGPARITALGVDVQIYPDADAFAASPASQLDPPPVPGRSPRRTTASAAGPGRRGWAPNRSSPTASSTLLTRPGRTPSCPAPSSKPARVCTLTGQPFTVATVRTAGFAADVCRPSASIPARPHPAPSSAATSPYAPPSPPRSRAAGRREQRPARPDAGPTIGTGPGRIVLRGGAGQPRARQGRGRGRRQRVLTPERSAVHRWGAELRARRDQRGLSLAGLAAWPGMTPVTWPAWSGVTSSPRSRSPGLRKGPRRWRRADQVVAGG